MTDLFRGAAYAVQGFGLIGTKSVRLIVAIPVVLTALLYAGAFWWTLNNYDVWSGWILDRIPPVLQWMEFLLLPILAVGAFLVFTFGFAIVATLVGLPFNGILAEVCEVRLTGRKIDGIPWAKLLLRLPGILFQELKKVIYYFAWMIPFLLLFAIPALNGIAPILWVAFSGWMLAVEYSDYPMGNHGLKFAEMRRRLKTRRFLATGFGVTVFFLFTIPILNFFVMPAAVCGATKMWLEVYRDA